MGGNKFLTGLRIFLLGIPRIEVNGIQVDVDTRKATALLAYLAVSRNAQSRDGLAALFWPEYDQSHARAALRRTLSVLKKALEGNWLIIERDMISLETNESLWTDIDEFQDHLGAYRRHGHIEQAVCPACLESLSKAAALYREDFMSGFTLRDSPAFDDWQLMQAESLRRDLNNILEKLVKLHSRLGDWDAGIRTARRWLSLDPLHEEAHRQLMKLYTWSGHRAAAIKQYQDCIHILEMELGVYPLEETTALYDAIRENIPLEKPPALEKLPEKKEDRPIEQQTAEVGIRHIRPFREHPLPMVGRAKEWMQMTQDYASVETKGRLIVLEGEAGVGKTRLAEEFLGHVGSLGGFTFTARCYEGETDLAYSTFAEALRGALTLESFPERLAQIPKHWLSEGARLVPEISDLLQGLPEAPPLNEPGAQTRLFEGILQLILETSRGEHPGVLFIDDVHWADAASLEMLAYLIRRLPKHPLVLLLTLRSEATPTTPTIQHLLADARRAEISTHLPISRLNQTEVEELLIATRSGLDIPLSALSLDLFKESEGLAFFVVEYLSAMPEDISGFQIGELPGSGIDLLRSRLTAVSETGWQLLTAAAVVGRSFDFETIREASGRSEEEVASEMEGLVRRGLIREYVGGEGSGNPTYDFSHEKLRSLVYQDTSLGRRRILHRRAAEALAGRGRHTIQSISSQIAYHFEQAGREVQAAHYYHLAGQQAARLFANREAIDYLRKALDLSETAGGKLDRADIHESIGDLYTLLGEYQAGIQHFQAALAIREPIRQSGLFHKMGSVYDRMGEWSQAEEHFKKSLDPQLRLIDGRRKAQIYADWSLTAHHSGQAERALELAQQALSLAELAGDKRTLAQVHNTLGVLARSQEDLEKACEHLEHSLHLAENLGDQAAQAAALNNMALVSSRDGNFELAIRLTKRALEMSESRGDRHREAALHNNLADMHHAAGQSKAAMEHLKKSVAIYAEIGIQAGSWQPEIWKLTEW
jgi:DNA-binding SARP family transcriptional activator/Tfp pilus assembly protein PilF